ncbi:heme-binding protein [Pontiella sp.]|uniref:heme-binding protein n=1 Tax=Pontiella sp. TaxID=2837462 RepID=UPI0035632EDE
MNAEWILCAALIAVPAMGEAYEKAFAATEAGKTEVKVIPQRTLIMAQYEAGYFEQNNDLFGRLFRYIKANDVAMTVPVKADIDPGKMYFYIGTKDLEKDLASTGEVRVMIEPERTVMSLGVRGGYSEKNYRQARERLLDTLAASKEWKKCGEEYAVFWNSPFVPAFLKKFEVHVPVEPMEGSKKE